MKSLHIKIIGLLLMIIPALAVAAEAPSTSVPLIQTKWGQNGDYARYSPGHERVGCWSTAIGQILYYHRLLPKGSIEYRCSNGVQVLCDFARYQFDFANLVNTIDGSTTEMQKNSLAAYLFVTAAVLEKDFGTGEYVIKARERASNVSRYFNCTARCFSTKDNSFDELEHIIVREIAARRPLMLHVRDTAHKRFHAVLIDAYKIENGAMYVHINMGFEGRHDGWYAFRGPIRKYDDLQYRRIMTICPEGTSSQVGDPKLHGSQPSRTTGEGSVN